MPIKKSHPIQVLLLQNEDHDFRHVLLEIVKPLQGPAFLWPEAKLWSQLDSGRTFLALSETKEVIAFVCCMDVGAAVELPVLATATAFQNLGVMETLLREIIATHYSAREIWLEVHEGNTAARKLYKKLGFTESGQRSSYYTDKSAAILCTKLPLGNDNI
jgi:ribosomal protein S18 acetylase RimI-like enzyme